MNSVYNNLIRGRKTEQVAYYQPYRGHMHNPGMGITAMALSDHMVTGYSEADRAAADKGPSFHITRGMMKELLEIPYIDNIYIRTGWNLVQKSAGKLDICEEMKFAVEETEKAGRTWGMRTMQCSPSDPVPDLLPEFLAGKLPMLEITHERDMYGGIIRRMPLYSEDYLKYWREMLLMLGEQYDGHPQLEYVDVSGFGLWGEGHHADFVFDTHEHLNSSLEYILDSYRMAFPKTPLVLNLHMCEEWEAGQKAVEEGIWVRRDSYYHYLQAHQVQDALCRRGDAAMLFECIMPGMHLADNPDPAFRANSFETGQSVCDLGVNYASVGFNPLDALYADHMMPQLYDVLKEHAGYRLRPSIIWKTEEEGKTSLILGMVNDGCANPPGDIRITASRGGKESSVTVNGGAFSERMHLTELPLPDADTDTVFLTMTLTMGKKTSPVSFAVRTGGQSPEKTLTIHLAH